MTLDDDALISSAWQNAMKREMQASKSHVAAAGARRMIAKWSDDEAIRGTARVVCELRTNDSPRFGLFGNSQEPLVLEVYTAVWTHSQARSFVAEGPIADVHGFGLKSTTPTRSGPSFGGRTGRTACT